MTTGLPQQPTFRSILLGIALFIIALLAFLRIGDVVKYTGTALMYIPAKLGLIDMVMPKDVIPLPLEENPSWVTIPSGAGSIRGPTATGFPTSRRRKRSVISGSFDEDRRHG